MARVNGERGTGWFARRRRLAGVLAMAAAAATCTPVQRAGSSPAYLLIASLEAAPGGVADVFRATLQSDVVTAGHVRSDLGRVTFRLGLKDPGTAQSPTVPSPVNFVTVDRYRVRFVRADGRDGAGVDVPYGFDSAMTLTVDAGGAVGTFVLVRAQAKLEPPLSVLVAGGGAISLATLAEVTFFGADQAGRSVSATGRIGVDFADWADPEE